MSDSYITILPVNVTHGQVKELAQRAIDWLTEREIISSKQSDCVLGQELLIFVHQSGRGIRF